MTRRATRFVHGPARSSRAVEVVRRLRDQARATSRRPLQGGTRRARNPEDADPLVRPERFRCRLIDYSPWWRRRETDASTRCPGVVVHRLGIATSGIPSSPRACEKLSVSSHDGHQDFDPEPVRCCRGRPSQVVEVLTNGIECDSLGSEPVGKGDRRIFRGFVREVWQACPARPIDCLVLTRCERVRTSSCRDQGQGGMGQSLPAARSRDVIAIAVDHRRRS